MNAPTTPRLALYSHCHHDMSPAGCVVTPPSSPPSPTATPANQPPQPPVHQPCANPVPACPCASLVHPGSQKTFDLGAKNSKTRSKYDTDSAWFWMLAGNTSTVTGATFDIARAVSLAVVYWFSRYQLTVTTPTCVRRRAHHQSVCWLAKCLLNVTAPPPKFLETGILWCWIPVGVQHQGYQWDTRRPQAAPDRSKRPVIPRVAFYVILSTFMRRSTSFSTSCTLDTSTAGPRWYRGPGVSSALF